jgi:prophage tail gpP-like protein
VKHQIDIKAGGKVIERWQRYRITCDMLSPADDFELELSPYSTEAAELVPPDAEIQVSIDGTRILTGYVDERRRRVGRDGTRLSISGRDKGGRLVDESMPLTTFRGLQTLQSLAEAAIGPWFTEVGFSNADNRTRLRGKRAHVAAAYGEPPVVFDRSKAPKKVEPGQSRWDVLASWLEPAQLLGWSTADGYSFVIGLPNYEQESQYAFRLPLTGSGFRGNVIEAELTESIAERYSRITVVGAMRGDSANYGRRVTKLRGVVSDGDGANGIGGSFAHRKTLILSDDEIKSAKDAEDRAIREMNLRNSGAEVITLNVPGHGQRYGPTTPATLYACDTIAEIKIDALDIDSKGLIVACDFIADKPGGEMTTLTLVPLNTILTQ